MIWWWLFSVVVGVPWAVAQWLALHYLGLMMLGDDEAD